MTDLSNSGHAVLVAVPPGILSKYGAGNWKDIQAQLLLLEALAVPFRVHEIDTPATIVAHCTPDITDVIVHYSWWPDLIADLRRTHPTVSIHVRAHNAEALQHWHRSALTWMPSYQNLRSIYGVVRLGWQDTLCRKRADTILGISQWDNRHYWQRLPGKATVTNQPYYSPWPKLTPEIVPVPWHSRERVMTCMPAGRDPLGRSMIAGFVLMAHAQPAPSIESRWRLCLSRGSLQNSTDENGTRQVESNFELLASDVHPWRVLCDSRAVAVLTPLGFGMKTTVIDALAAGCHVLVHPILSRRLPAEVRDNCIIVDPSRRQDARRAWDLMEQAPRAHNVNENLRSQAFEAVRQAIVDHGRHGHQARDASTESASTARESSISPSQDSPRP